MGCCNGDSNSGCCQDEVQHSNSGNHMEYSQKTTEAYICPQCGKETTLQKRMNASKGSCSSCGCASDKE